MEIRKTEFFAEWIGALQDTQAERAFWPESNASFLETPAMFDRSAKVSPNCEFRTALATAFISNSSGANS